jgi:hypothetical protein
MKHEEGKQRSYTTGKLGCLNAVNGFIASQPPRPPAYKKLLSDLLLYAQV